MFKYLAKLTTVYPIAKVINDRETLGAVLLAVRQI